MNTAFTPRDIIVASQLGVIIVLHCVKSVSILLVIVICVRL